MRFLFRNHAGRREWSEKLKEWRGEPHQIRGVYFAELFFKSKGEILLRQTLTEFVARKEIL